MAERRNLLGLSWALLVAMISLTACSTAPPPVSAPAPRVITAADMDAAAELMALEDRLEYDVWTIGPAAAAREPFLRERAVLTIGRLRDPAGRTLTRILLEDEDSAVAAAAAFSAGLLVDTVAVDPLATILADSSGWSTRPTVAVEAARALGRIGSDRSRDVLVDLLATGDPGDSVVSPVAAEALLALVPAPDAVLPAIIRWIESADPEVRWRAAYALTRPARAEGVQAARTLLSDPDALVRTAALRGVAAPLVEAAGVSRAEVLERVVALTADSAYSVRIEAIRALGTYTEVRSVETLRDLLGSERPHDIAAALESLGRLGASAAPAAVTMMGKTLDPALPPYLRGLGLVNLASVDSAGARPIIHEFAVSESWRLRAAAADALIQAGAGALPGLRELARDRDPRVAAAAVRAATQAPDSTSTPLLRSLLIEMLSSRDVHVRAAALDGLATLADGSTYPALLDAYERARHDDEPDAALAAVDAIASIGVAGAVRPGRAFFARFTRPLNHLVRQRAVERFGDEARTAWGDPLPVTDPEQRNYRDLVEAWQAPAAAAIEPIVVRFDTESGVVDVELLGGAAPLTTANFLALVDSEYFNGQEWPRVVPNFVVQGGDPRGDTSGGPGYTIRDELNRVRYTTGTVGMALAGSHTGGSQFFIVHSPQPHLDGTYTVFGRVLRGQEVLERVLPGERLNSVQRLADQL